MPSLPKTVFGLNVCGTCCATVTDGHSDVSSNSPAMNVLKRLMLRKVRRTAHCRNALEGQRVGSKSSMAVTPARRRAPVRGRKAMLEYFSWRRRQCSTRKASANFVKIGSIFSARAIDERPR